MKIEKVTGQRFRAVCLLCEREEWAGDGYTFYADLDGAPFKAYYCEQCRPLFAHHCDSCVYVGPGYDDSHFPDGKHLDLYYCPRADGGSFLGRYSDDWIGHYLSCPYSVWKTCVPNKTEEDWRAQAERLARRKGLIA